MSEPLPELPRRLRERLRRRLRPRTSQRRDRERWWYGSTAAGEGRAAPRPRPVPLSGPRPAPVDELIDPATASADHFAPGFETLPPCGPEVVFFDLETTGLGHGDAIFLAGLLWREGDGLRLRQELARDVAEERALLEAVTALLAAHPLVVTYNGLGFDLPFLRRRLRFHSLPPPPADLVVEDLLLSVRRLAAGQWPSCRLAAAEERLLHKQRTGEDIPGALVPARFAAWLDTGDEDLLAPIVYHNRIDLTSLAALRPLLARA